LKNRKIAQRCGLCCLQTPYASGGYPHISPISLRIIRFALNYNHRFHV